MKKRCLHLINIFSLLLIPILSFSQSANKAFHETKEGNIFENDEGSTIEYLGMKNWTAREIQDSLKSLAPNRPVSACMAVLKNNLGFADAMVMSYYEPEKSSLYTVVTVLEDKNRQNTVPLPKNEKPPIEKWSGDLNLNDRSNQNLLSNGLQFFGKENGRLHLNTERVMKSSFFSEEDSEFLKEFYNHIKHKNTEADRLLAHNTLQEDGNKLNRILASIVLLNFDNSKEEKYMMLNQMRSDDQQISRFSATILKIMIQNGTPVDWLGATDTIRSLLAGTNLHNFTSTIEVLTKTKVSSSLVDKILSNNTFLLEERLQARHGVTKQKTLAFVNQMSSKELDDSSEAVEWLSQY